MHVLNLLYMLSCHLSYLENLFSWYIQFSFLDKKQTNLTQLWLVSNRILLVFFIRNTVFDFSQDFLKFLPNSALNVSNMFLTRKCCRWLNFIKFWNQAMQHLTFLWKIKRFLCPHWHVNRQTQCSTLKQQRRNCPSENMLHTASFQLFTSSMVV